MTTESLPLLRYTPEEFVDAFDNGVFEGRGRVQLIDGMVWELAGMQGWHGRAVPRVAGLLAQPGVIVTTQTLPMPNSLPDPDVWVLREGAVPTGSVGPFETWDSADVLLVVEVADTTRSADLGVKASIYASGGVQHYWVLTKTGLHVFWMPRPDPYGGYAYMELLGPDDDVSLPYATGREMWPGRTFLVSDLIG